jgi:hypothetical protein
VRKRSRPFGTKSEQRQPKKRPVPQEMDDEISYDRLADLNHLNIAWLNEVMVILTRFIKYVDGNSISYFDIFPMLQKLTVDLRYLRANEHAETLIQTVSERFSRATDLNVIFVCCLVTQAGKKFW